jgi:hypothetical protein
MIRKKTFPIVLSTKPSQGIQIRRSLKESQGAIRSKQMSYLILRRNSMRLKR